MLKELRRQSIIWIGIVGCVLTIVDYWSKAIPLSTWMRFLVKYWAMAMDRCWNSLAVLFDLKVSNEAADLLSLVFFYTCLTLGSIFSPKSRRKYTKRDIYFMMPAAVFWAVTVGFTAMRIGGIPSLPATLGFFILYVLYVSLPIALYAEEDKSASLFFVMTSLVVLNLGLFGVGFRYVINLTSGSSSWVYILTLLLVSSVMFLAFIAPVIFVPNGVLIKRTAVLLIGVGIIFGVNEISKIEAKLQAATQSIAPS